jgi:hypothetical protein
MLDTERGVVIWHRIEGGGGDGPRSHLQKDVDEDGPDGWAAFPTFEIQELFDMQNQYFIKMKYIPHVNDGKEIWELDPRSESGKNARLKRSSPMRAGRVMGMAGYGTDLQRRKC